MPEENYYCPDNFFKKMTDLESPKKNNDCYFYYYSTCAKGDSCTFRHEPSALGCETMCSFWKEGKCLNVHCNFRHMELRKNRKAIPCYWESQPVGCLKAHCPFMHQNPRPSDEVAVDKSNISTEKSSNDNDSSERKVTAVDSLVVNFEEESDNESMPTYSPLKSNRIVKVKTLEEIKLEQIQAESAAYYSYAGHDLDFQSPSSDGDDLRQRIVRRITCRQVPQPERIIKFKTSDYDKTINKRLNDNELSSFSGFESLRKKQKIIHQKTNGNFQVTLSKLVPEKIDQSTKHSKNISHKPKPDVQNIKIKTLAEIRAERNAQRGNVPSDQWRKKTIIVQEQDETEVSSTSMDETIQKTKPEDNRSETGAEPRRKIKLRRKFLTHEETVVSSNNKDENDVQSSKNFEENNSREHSMETMSDNSINPKYSRSDSDKMDEDVLLLGDDEEDYEDVTLKAEEELLNEINSFIDN